MKKIGVLLALGISTMAQSKLDLNINLQVDGLTIIRKLTSTTDKLEGICEDRNLKFEVHAWQNQEKIELEFWVYKRIEGNGFELKSHPHLIADPGVPAVIELKEEAPKDRGPVLRQICDVLKIKPRMVEKSTLRLVVVANK